MAGWKIIIPCYLELTNFWNLELSLGLLFPEWNHLWKSIWEDSIKSFKAMDFNSFWPVMLYGGIDLGQYWPIYVSPDGTKPLSGPMLTYHQQCTMLFSWEQFHKKCLWTVSVITFLKLLPLPGENKFNSYKWKFAIIETFIGGYSPHWGWHNFQMHFHLQKW